MYIQQSWSNKLTDELSITIEMLGLDDVAHARPVCRAWSSNLFAQRKLLLGRLAELLVARIKKTHHAVPAGSVSPGPFQSSGEDVSFPTIVVNLSMDTTVFELLFGRQIGIIKRECPVELTLKKPVDVLATIPALPLVVPDVNSNAPCLPLCPLRCWAGYADGQIKYDPAGSKFTLAVRSRVLKLSGYWEKSLDDKVLADYLEA